MRSSLVEKPMLASGTEYAIDCRVFIVTDQLLYYYTTVTTSCMSANNCAVAIASWHSFHPQIESKVVTRGGGVCLRNSGVSSLSLLGN